LWGLSLIAVTIAYMGPLAYISNREIVDEQIHNAQELLNAQAHHVKGLAEQQTAHAKGLVKQYASDYSAKAQEYIGNRRSASPEATKVPSPVKTEPVSPPSSFQHSDFPEAPRNEPVAESSAEAKPEPLLAL
jgi:hypothetical protein